MYRFSHVFDKCHIWICIGFSMHVIFGGIYYHSIYLAFSMYWYSHTFLANIFFSSKQTDIVASHGRIIFLLRIATQRINKRKILLTFGMIRKFIFFKIWSLTSHDQKKVGLLHKCHFNRFIIGRTYKIHWTCDLLLWIEKLWASV